MYSRNDPRLRRTLNQVSQNLESATESAQANLWSFSHNYLNPCFNSAGNCIRTITAPCFPSREQRLRRRRGRSRGIAELSFDFYDDWDEEENDALLGWGNGEFDRLLGSSSGYGGTSQPGRERAMSYGTRRERVRRKSTVHPHDGRPDPTIIPNTSYFGFLGRLPWKIGGKGLRYKPSAADLQEHPGAARRANFEEQPLIEESDEESEHILSRRHRRNRSDTSNSGHTVDSLSSRGDIFPSEDEADAVPIDDEFAMVLERQRTGLGSDENISNRTKYSKRPSESRVSTRTASSRSTRGSGKRVRGNSMSSTVPKPPESSVEEVPTLSELKQEEDRVQQEEEKRIEKMRRAAQELALKRGLGTGLPTSPSAEDKTESPIPTPPSQRTRVSDMCLATSPPSPALVEETIPFPAFDPQTQPENLEVHPGDILEPRYSEENQAATTPHNTSKFCPRTSDADSSPIPHAGSP